MLTLDSTILEIEQAHEAMNMKQIAKEIGIGEKKLKHVLSSMGYEYDSAERKWRYVLMDESKDYRNRSLWLIMEYGVNSNIDITDVDTIDVEEKNTNDITDDNTDITHEFTQEEIMILKHLAQQQLAKGTVENDSGGAIAILEVIQSVPTGSTSKEDIRHSG
ncbi:phage antirepressor KilAC domain-containing protein [Lysinibacillus piscis]|uniref:Uncharacterized protein n=1 Tax=Lysinibacillus piscis TaxID=2518931 RepID=A0ABQ5NKC7_9BACI|nr:phage antirepressor KilAC domain-containing protein [Lysinibacillus sp. KH24]GLC88757.1 hypothetical protein LYSBPC_18840 [Lysinibacillus sp. KH24]